MSFPMMEQIPDAPWIRDAERTGYYKGGWWNNPPEPDEYEDDEGDEDEQDE